MLSLDPQINYSVFASKRPGFLIGSICSLFFGPHGDFKDSVPPRQKSTSSRNFSQIQGFEILRTFHFLSLSFAIFPLLACFDA